MQDGDIPWKEDAAPVLVDKPSFSDFRQPACNDQRTRTTRLSEAPGHRQQSHAVTPHSARISDFNRQDMAMVPRHSEVSWILSFHTSSTRERRIHFNKCRKDMKENEHMYCEHIHFHSYFFLTHLCKHVQTHVHNSTQIHTDEHAHTGTDKHIITHT